MRKKCYLNFETLFVCLETKWTEDKKIKEGSDNNYQNSYLFAQDSLLYLEELLELDDSKQLAMNASFLHWGLYCLHQELECPEFLKYWPTC